METIFKRFVIAGMVMTSIGFGNRATAKDGEKNISNNPLTETNEHRSIEFHLNNIQREEASIDALKGEIKEWKKEGYDVGLEKSRIELKQAKADLKCEKAGLKADKKALLKKQSALIDEQRDQKREARYALMDAKSQMRRDLRKGNVDQLEADADRVCNLETEYTAYKESQFTLEQDRSDYVFYVNDEIRSTRGETAALNPSEENSLASMIIFY